MDISQPPLILASTSRYRADLLRRLGIAFTQQAPEVDEAERPGEAPAARALRLATAKAAAIRLPHRALVIGSDQVSSLHGSVRHKPGDHASACTQLRASSGEEVLFHTAVCVRDSRTGDAYTHVDSTAVHFRELDEAEIERYVAREQPFDCAGSFKCEGLGITLFTRIDTQDPSALIGLPLIALSRMLRQCGLALP